VSVNWVIPVPRIEMNWPNQTVANPDIPERYFLRAKWDQAPFKYRVDKIDSPRVVTLCV